MARHAILAEARKFAALLERSTEVKRYREAEMQVNRSDAVQQTIAAIKRKQKELVHAKHYQKPEYVRLLEQELERLNQRLDHLPIVREYQQAQVEVNGLLQTIQQVIADTVSKKINVETGGEVASGCGSGGACGCR
ncbi:RicAFT regulatory complex protein RicA family protein [Laceyella putida]|uniref:RicAFT regulatory complex protein RicA family protein n=1 Tax=Laceyella putida TaxID=110101 RepID=A0ABW2RKL2_9BACL